MTARAIAAAASGITMWRLGTESNRCNASCSRGHDHSATQPSKAAHSTRSYLHSETRKFDQSLSNPARNVGHAARRYINIEPKVMIAAR